MIKIAESFKKNYEKIEKIEKIKDAEHEKYTTAHDKLLGIYWDKERNLEKEKNLQLKALSDIYDKKKKEKNLEIEQLHTIISEVKEIIMFLNIDTLKNIDIPTAIKTYHDDVHIENIGSLFDGDFLKINAFVFGNSKPVNKFSLALLGKTLLPESVMSLPYSYGLPSFHGDYDFRLKTIIKDAMSVDELKRYFNKMKDKLVDKYTVGYPESRQKYDDMISKYKLEDFDGISDLLKNE